MAVYKCRKCDLCGTLLGRRDAQWHLRKPRLYYGYLELGMKRQDVCDDCMSELLDLVDKRRLKKDAPTQPI